MIAGLNIEKSVFYLSYYSGVIPLQYATFNHISELLDFIKDKGIRKLGIITKPHDGKPLKHYNADIGLVLLVETLVLVERYRMTYSATCWFHGLAREGKEPKYTRNRVKAFVLKHSDLGTKNHNHCPIPKALVDAGLAAITMWMCHGKQESS